MRAIVQVISGPEEGRRFPLQHGERASLGRSSRAAVCLSGDVEMSELHFELQSFDDHCVIRDLNSASGTFVNNEPISEQTLHNGDMVAAGQTTMQVWLSDNPLAVEPQEPEASPPACFDVVPEPDSLAEICRDLDLEEESTALLDSQDDVHAFVLKLIGHESFGDAVRVLAHSLSKRQAIWWAYNSLQHLDSEGLSAENAACRQAARQWIEEPNEEHRQIAMHSAEAAKDGSTSKWLAMSVAWSHGSLTPPDLPEVAPDKKLAHQGITATLLIAANQGDPLKINDRYEQILKIGMEVLDGTLDLPDQAMSQ